MAQTLKSISVDSTNSVVTVFESDRPTKVWLPNNLGLQSAIVSSTKDSSKTKDVTQVIQNLMVMNDDESGFAITLYPSKINEYSCGDIHFGTLKKMTLTFTPWAASDPVPAEDPDPKKWTQSNNYKFAGNPNNWPSNWSGITTSWNCFNPTPSGPGPAEPVPCPVPAASQLLQSPRRWT